MRLTTAFIPFLLSNLACDSEGEEAGTRPDASTDSGGSDGGQAGSGGANTSGRAQSGTGGDNGGSAGADDDGGGNDGDVDGGSTDGNADAGTDGNRDGGRNDAARDRTSTRQCTEIETDYSVAFAEAQSCNASVMPHECTTLRSDSPGCGCPMLVNPANTAAITRMSALTDEYADAGCDLNACPDAATCPPRGQIACQAASSLCAAP